MKSRHVILGVALAVIAVAGAVEVGESAVSVEPPGSPGSPPQPPAVAVDLSQIRDEVADAFNAEPSQVPDSVRLPLSEAAFVCATTEAELRSSGGPSRCVARRTSTALSMAVQHAAQMGERGSANLPRPTAPSP